MPRPGIEPGSRVPETVFSQNNSNYLSFSEIKEEKWIIDYPKVRLQFIKWMKENCSEEHANKMTSYLDRYLLKQITDPKELFELISSVKRGKRHLCMAIRDLLKFYEAFDLMSEERLIKYRKVVKIPKGGTDDYIPDNDKVIQAFKKFRDERYRKLFKLLAFSGIRLREAIHFFNNFNKNKLIVNEKIAKYPLSLDRRTKRSYYVYMPKDFAFELEKMEIEEKAISKYFEKRRLPAKYLRKWNYNLLILNGVPESVADFIQGRASITVGSMHYLAKVKQADEWYSRVVDKFINLLST